MEGIDGEGILRNQRGGELENWRMWFVFIQEQFYFLFFRGKYSCSQKILNKK